MLDALDTWTLIFVGSMTSFLSAGVMVYYSLSRRTYPGFHYWTAGFVLGGLGILLILIPGLPKFFSHVIGNICTLAIPYMIVLGLSKFVNIQPFLQKYNIFLVLSTLCACIWGTYVEPGSIVRIVLMSVTWTTFSVEILWLSVVYVPNILGERNDLLVGVSLLSAISYAVRFIDIVILKSTYTNFLHPGMAQNIGIVMTLLSITGFVAPLIIISAHRLERDLKDANAQLDALANTDGLTGLFNRRYFDESLSREFHRLQRNREPLSLIMADIDFFKRYNDTYGHQAGDDCIRAVADTFKSHGRRITDIPARYGGEEFALILPDTNSSGAIKVALSIKDNIINQAIPHSASETGDIVTLSMGVASTVPDQSGDPAQLIECADRALYRSKEEGRNRISIA